MTKTPRFSGRALAILSPVVFLVACAKPGFEPAAQFANKTTGSVGCESFESNFFDQLYQSPTLPSEIEMRQAFANSTKNLQSLSIADQTRVSDELSNLYKLLAVDALAKLNVTNASSQLKVSALAALEIGDSTTPEKEQLQADIKNQVAKIESIVGHANAQACAPSLDNGATTKTPSSGSPTTDGTDTGTTTPSAGTLFAQWKSTQTKIIYGALKSMSTAYQSCEAATLPALDKNTPLAVGIHDAGVGPDGVGHKRTISDIGMLFQTHPYLKGYRLPASASKASCFDVTRNVPIYDFGGRPATSSGSFDLFTNTGGETSALGTDCSGYVFMSIASGGLRIKKSTAVKASLISGISSTLFTNPQKNGLTCFDYVTLKGTDVLHEGDVIAKAGHVVIVKSVGVDPFGVSGLTDVSQCTLANMSYKRFNFTIIQDSPSKGGIGIQQSNVADYLPDESVMPEGLTELAVNVCKAKFGISTQAKNSKIAVVRHAGTPECMNATEIALSHESCVASCPAN